MTATNSSYAKMSAQLEEIMDRLQNGDLDIDEATAAYEQGMIVIQKLEQHLANSENTVKKIKARFDK